MTSASFICILYVVKFRKVEHTTEICEVRNFLFASPVYIFDYNSVCGTDCIKISFVPTSLANVDLNQQFSNTTVILVN